MTKSICKLSGSLLMALTIAPLTAAADNLDYTAAAIDEQALSILKSSIVNSVAYPSCGSNWYSRAYSGGSVTYVIVNPPPGY